MRRRGTREGGRERVEPNRACDWTWAVVFTYGGPVAKRGATRTNLASLRIAHGSNRETDSTDGAQDAQPLGVALTMYIIAKPSIAVVRVKAFPPEWMP